VGDVQSNPESSLQVATVEVLAPGRASHALSLMIFWNPTTRMSGRDITVPDLSQPSKTQPETDERPLAIAELSLRVWGSSGMNSRLIIVRIEASLKEAIWEASDNC
jgi:hypothetical protein